jgi:hypothetical protein
MFSVVSFVSVAILLGNDVFCSSKFLSEASKKATTFCTFQGALIHYLEGSVTLWFVAYNAVVAKVDLFLSLIFYCGDGGDEDGGDDEDGGM